MRTYYVYILASQRNGTLYVGVTGDLSRRVWEHKESLTPGFTSEHCVVRLVWYEEYGDISDAILREKRVKRWRREWKLRLIEEGNPQWLDLYETWNC
jgi:putative endonuclease